MPHSYCLASFTEFIIKNLNYKHLLPLRHQYRCTLNKLLHLRIRLLQPPYTTADNTRSRCTSPSYLQQGPVPHEVRPIPAYPVPQR